jgi:hypothetical protein
MLFLQVSLSDHLRNGMDERDAARVPAAVLAKVND